MLCQKCNKREAVIHVKQSVNGKKTEMMLCRECAELDGVSPFFGMGTDELFSGFFSDSVFGGSSIHEPKKCKNCGMSGAELAKNGRVGCAKCYDVFEQELSKIIYGIHGNAVHTGSVPGNRAKQLEKQKRIDELKKEQQIAINDQNYERAAQIRDKIKQIESEEGGEDGVV